MMPMNIAVVLHSSRSDEIVKKINEAAGEAEPEAFSSTDSVLQLLSLCLLLIVILIAAYYTSKFIGRYKMGQLKDSNIRIIEAYRLGTNKMLQIVKIANKYVVLGISKDQIIYITELDESEVLTHDIHEGEKLSFRQIYEKIKGKKQ
ncbi:MAG TPA: flagellar biosynthetic protein FliO [Clostridiales bacterium]|jgi:flagellar protein FliO/FliZ|nr:flagellar biosynthetic protein FliO [Clostridiales bacterium]